MLSCFVLHYIIEKAMNKNAKCLFQSFCASIIPVFGGFTNDAYKHTKDALCSEWNLDGSTF